MDTSRRSFLRGRVSAAALATPATPADRSRLRPQIAPHCLALRHVECRICGEACDARALRFPPRLGGIAVPVLDTDACTGCGDCVAPCPAGALALHVPPNHEPTA